MLPFAVGKLPFCAVLHKQPGQFAAFPLKSGGLAVFAFEFLRQFVFEIKSGAVFERDAVTGQPDGIHTGNKLLVCFRR